MGQTITKDKEKANAALKAEIAKVAEAQLAEAKELLSLLQGSVNIIDVALNRGAVKGAELSAVALLRQGLVAKAQKLLKDTEE